MILHCCPVIAGEPNNYLTQLSPVLGGVPPQTSIFKGGFAYATLGGVQKLCSQASAAESWSQIEKQFIIGVHQAITEPSALIKLAELPRATVKVFIPRRRLSLASFSDSPIFHPKVMAVCSRNPVRLHFIQAGSANLTKAALGSPSVNTEFGLGIASSQNQDLDADHKFRDWWTELWRASHAIDEALIKKYAALRSSVLDKNPLLRHVVEPPEDLREAQYFFTEVGAGSGPPDARHQVEFPESLARFFGPVRRGRRSLCLTNGKREWTGRPLSFKTTTYGVEIWRLGMPTQATGGEPIAERAIRFSRTDAADTFGFRIVDTDSAEFRRWKANANAAGHIGATRGQRSRVYGFYS